MKSKNQIIVATNKETNISLVHVFPGQSNSYFAVIRFGKESNSVFHTGKKAYVVKQWSERYKHDTRKR